MFILFTKSLGNNNKNDGTNMQIYFAKSFDYI